MLTTHVVYDFGGVPRRAVIEYRPERRIHVIRQFVEDPAMLVAWRVRRGPVAVGRWRTPRRRSLPVSLATTYPWPRGTRAQSGVRRDRENGHHAVSVWFATAVRGVATQRGRMAAQQKPESGRHRPGPASAPHLAR